MKRVLRIIVILYVAWTLLVLYVKSFDRFTLEEMDWNGDGHTSLGEIWRASNYRPFDTVSPHRTCRSIIQLKDGIEVYHRCVDVK